tara:strand:- start:107 stop:256 length:150 start_codon:yes stop_codon:yes gene_type:complete
MMIYLTSKTEVKKYSIAKLPRLIEVSKRNKIYRIVATIWRCIASASYFR